jgi:hypothetical protein
MQAGDFPDNRQAEADARFRINKVFAALYLFTP